MANVHHHLAVAVPKTFHTPRPMSYWNETSEMSAVLYLPPPPPVTPCGCTTHAPCWGLYKAQLVDQPGRNAQSMRHLPHTETLCSPTTNPDAFYTTVPWYGAVAQAHRSGLRGSGSLEPPALRGCVRSADRVDVLEGPLVPHEAWATSRSLLTYGIMLSLIHI